jgi:glycosyltransferase involved in cell wall biosynthesis
MIIGIEGQRLFRKKKHGMDMVALELIRNLQAIDTKNQYFIYIAPDVDRSCLTETSNFKIRVIGKNFYPIWEQFSLPKAAKADGCQVLHCTSNTAPLVTNIPLVVTLHDIIYMEKNLLRLITGKGTPYQKFGNVYRRLVVPRILKSSQKVITVSNYEKQRITDFFKLGNNKLTAIYNGVGKHFKKVTDPIELQRVKQKYSLPDKFFFHLGNTDPKKNTAGVLKAYANFLRTSNEHIPMVMLDYELNELQKLLNEMDEPNLFKSIHLTGYVVNTDLPAIYSQCEQFLYPSLRESFGIPLLEAMACGTPVISSNTSCMPEISGGAAWLVNPFDTNEITQAMLSLHSDKQLANSFIEKGFVQSSKFSWHQMAADVLKLYGTILK